MSSPGTWAVLIGTGTHAAGSGLPNVPAVHTTLVDLEQVLVQQCGMAESNVRVLADPRSPLEVGRVLAESAQQAQDVLLVCYVGHGLVSPGGELYLATQSTERQAELLAYTALASTAVRTSLLQSPARSIVVILDCCFSGKAVVCWTAPWRWTWLRSTAGTC